MQWGFVCVRLLECCCDPALGTDSSPRSQRPHSCRKRSVNATVGDERLTYRGSRLELACPAKRWLGFARDWLPGRSGLSDCDAVYHSNHAARVLQLWYSDSRFVDQLGSPRALPFAGDEPSFSSLVRAAGGDVPPGAVRAELADASSIVEAEQGYLQPVKRYFVPADVGEELVVGFTHIVTPVLEGLARNTDLDCVQPFIQRLAYSDRLITSAIPLFREVARDRATEFVQVIDDWLSAHEANAEVVGDDKYRVGLGVFYYEGPHPVSSPVPAGPAGSSHKASAFEISNP